MRTIYRYKYDLSQPEFTINDEISRILSAQMRSDDLFIYVEKDTDMPNSTYKFKLATTLTDLDACGIDSSYEYLSTVQINSLQVGIMYYKKCD